VGDAEDSDDRPCVVESRFQACAIEPAAKGEVAFRRFAGAGTFRGEDERVRRIPVGGKIDGATALPVDADIGIREKARSEDRCVPELEIREPDESRYAGDEPVEPRVQRREPRAILELVQGAPPARFSASRRFTRIVCSARARRGLSSPKSETCDTALNHRKTARFA
jgi:hypothetical protein